MLKTRRTQLDKTRLRHCVEIATHTFREHAKTMEAAREEARTVELQGQQAPGISSDAANRLHEEFKRYYREASEMLDVIDGVDAIEVVTEEEDDDESELG